MELGLAFLMGLGGSVHCLGMCSGFALAVARGGARRHLLHQALYSGGRLSSYIFLGLLAGTLGQSLHILVPLKTAQASLAIAAGAIMILVGLRMLGLMVDGRWQAISRWLWAASCRLQTTANSLSGAIRSLIPPTSSAQAFYLGLLNGLMPCPMIYAALPAALAMGSGAQGGLLMLAVGAGTLPMMLGVGVAGRALIPRAERLVRIPGLVVLIFGFVTLGRVLIQLGPGVHMGH